LDIGHWSLNFVCDLVFDAWTLTPSRRGDSSSEPGDPTSARGDLASAWGDPPSARGDEPPARPAGANDRVLAAVLPADAPPAAPGGVLWGGDESHRVLGKGSIAAV
jgi:hypothetical protein